MGKGIDLARQYGDPRAAQAIEDMKDQLIIALVRRLANKDGTFSISAAEIDNTGGLLLKMDAEPNKSFTFTLVHKS